MSILIAIDAGHGSQTAGKRTPDGYREHWINVKTAYACEQYLLAHANYIKVLRVAWDDTNSTDDTDVALTTRQNQINNANCDFSVSFHANAYGDGASYNSANGVETLIHSVDSYQNDSLRFAECIQSYLIQGTSQKNRGVKEQYLAMCQCDAMRVTAAALVEIGFMTNKIEADLMVGEAFCKEQGEEVAKGIIAYIEKYYPDKISDTTTSTTNLYRVRYTWDDAKSQKGAFANLENAKAECNKYVGYSVYDWNGVAVYGREYTEPIKFYRVRKSWSDSSSQLGAFSVLENAKALCDQNEGYTVYNCNGEPVYGAEYNQNQLYRVRLSWDNVRSQLGAYKELANAKAICDQYEGYHVFDIDGNIVYSNAKSNSEVTEDTETKDENVSEEITTPNEPSEEVTEEPKEETSTEEEKTEAKIISPVYGFNNEEFIEYIGEKANKDMEQSGILASITTAQAILESSYGQSELSLYANNIFGMKATLSGNNWKSDWTGNTYAKYSPEEDADGNTTLKKSEFRAYETIDASIKDHSDYLNGALKSADKLRYEGLSGEVDYTIAAQIIKDGGYATDSGYVAKLCNIIEKYNLSRFDLLGDLDEEENEVVEETPETEEKIEENIEDEVKEETNENEVVEEEKDTTDEELKDIVEDVNKKLDIIKTIVEGIKYVLESIYNLLKKIFK